MYLIILFICLSIFLYVIHYFAHDDFVILKKNVSMEQIFNVVFITLAFVFFISRLFFIILNLRSSYLNPIVFLAFPYFPGFSLTGAVVGGSAFLLWYLKKKRFPVKRILDFFSTSLLTVIPVYLFLNVLIYRKFLIGPILEGIFFTLLLIIFYTFILPKYFAGKIKDGFPTGLFFIGYFLITLLTEILEKKNIYYIIIQTAILSVALIIVIGFLVREKIIPKLKDLK